jgi:6-phosphogluconate dehydrogenase
LSFFYQISDDVSCLCHTGAIGSGNYIKMVHNGIEYALMQVIAEVVSCLSQGCRASFDDVAAVIDEWNKDGNSIVAL